MVELIAKSVLSLGFAAALLYATLRFIQRFLPGSNSYLSKNTSIKLNFTSYLDYNTKIVSLDYKNKEYLILVGKNSEIIIDKFENEKS